MMKTISSSVSTIRQLRPCALHRACKDTRSVSWKRITLNHALGRSKDPIKPKIVRKAFASLSSSTGLVQPPVEALIFDCDGVIVESEDIHRRAYNATFENFQVVCPGQNGVVEWTEEFYDMLQNKVGGGKPKMRWYFGENGWPSSSILGQRVPETEEEQVLLIDTLQDWKTQKYMDIIGSGQVHARKGVIELMDMAKAAGIPVAVCSAATKEAVIFVLESLLGPERFSSLDLFMAGDDVPVKKPDPTIYKVAAQRLGISDPARCLVIEDSVIGLQAALGADMKCVITYTTSTASQDFSGATSVLESLDGIGLSDVLCMLDSAATRKTAGLKT